MFSWPGQFHQPIDLTQLKSTLYWRRTAEEFLVATTDLQIGARNASVHAKAAWRQPSDGSSPILSLASTVDGGNLTDTHLFLPREQLAPSALAWLDRAFIAGRLSHADAIIQGPMRHFPFRDGSGLFLARCHIEGMTLDYREGWPRIEGLARRSGISQRRDDRAALERPHQRPHRGFRGCALRRFQEWRAADSRSPARRRGRCIAILASDAARRRHRPRLFRGGGQGSSQVHRQPVFSIQTVRSTPGIGACRLEGCVGESSGLDARGDRFDGRGRYRRRSGFPRRRARPRSGRRFPDECTRAAQPGGDPHAIGLPRDFQR